MADTSAPVEEPGLKRKPTGGRSPTAKQAIRGADLERQAWSLRLAGASYPQIGQRLGCSAQGAFKAVSRVLARHRAESAEVAEQLREMELARLDAALVAIAPQVQNGHLGAIDRWIRLGESRRRLMGLDAPPRAAVDETGATVETRVVIDLGADTRDRGIHGDE